jgi:hypothetical protein
MQRAETNIVGVFLVRSKAAPLQARLTPQHEAFFVLFAPSAFAKPTARQVFAAIPIFVFPMRSFAAIR